MKKSLLLAILLIVSCGPKKALISQQEIDQAKTGGNLEALYAKADQLVKQSKGSEQKEATGLRSTIADLLVEEHSPQVETILEQHKKDIKSVDRKTLLDNQAEIKPMQEWSPNDYKLLNSRLDQALVETNKLISQATLKAKQKQSSPVDYVKNLKQASELAGEEQPERLDYEKAFKQSTEQFLYEGNQALSKKLYNTVIKSAEKGLLIDPNNIQFESLLSQGKAGLFEKDFRFALENGKPEMAYQTLSKISDESVFVQVKKSMQPSILVLADYFAGSAQKAYQSGYLATAYQDFTKARNIQSKLSISPKGFAQERNFLNLLMSKAKNISLGEGKRLTYMRVINEFDPYYPGLKTDYLKLKEQVKKRALTKLAVTDFKEIPSGNSVIASIGRRIASQLEKTIFERLGNEVLVVTHINSVNSYGFNGLSLKLDGEVLQAAIESQTNRGQRSQEVQTSVNRVETEEYLDWKKRKKGDAPNQYHETPIKEQIALNVEHIQKQAIAEVGFKIVEPATGKILLTDNLLKEAEYKGESINEYQKGDFHQPYVKADLPSDIKIMDSLATQLADGLGEKLLKYLQSPENVFYDKYVQAKNRGDKTSATELLANALIIAEDKSTAEDKSKKTDNNKTTDDWYRQLKSIVL